MTRSIRIQFPGAFYHIFSRGNAKQGIFLEDSDRDRFLHLLSNTVNRYEWIVHGYCLMSNHYHLLLETPLPNLSDGMRFLNGQYAQKFNFSHNRVGHLFEKRFGSHVVERDLYLLELTRYIALNPVRAGLVDHPACYEWSSYRPATGRCATPAFLNIETTLGLFSHNTLEAMRLYEDFALEAIDREIRFEIRAGVLLGSDIFCAKLEEEFLRKENKKGIKQEQLHAFRPKLAQLFASEMDRVERNEQIFMAHKQYGYRQKEIADHLGLACSTLNKIIKQEDFERLENRE